VVSVVRWIDFLEDHPIGIGILVLCGLLVGLGLAGVL
jgi:hypothetical protein